MCIECFISRLVFIITSIDAKSENVQVIITNVLALCIYQHIVDQTVYTSRLL